MGSRVSLSALLYTSSLGGPTRIGGTYLAYVSPLQGPTRVSGTYFVRVQSSEKALYPNLLESASEIYGVAGYDIVYSAPTAPEHNPYRPTIPEELSALGDGYYNYARENQEIQREQHDITQAGDSTFPWQMFVTSHVNKQFNLGSLSRFYHEDYGIIHCRYVKFDFMASVVNIACPVGLVAANGTLDWVVTNRIDMSHPDLVVGILAPFALPADGTYGWVIVNGPNLQQTGNVSLYGELGESFAWEDTGFVSNIAAGRVLGRRLNDPKNKSLTPGQLFVCLESFSLTQISDEITAITDALSDKIQSLENKVDVLESLTDLDGTITNLIKLTNALQKNLDAEVKTRRAADTAINKRISELNYVTNNQLTQTIATLQNGLAAIQTATNSSIETVRQIALEALNLAGGFNLTVINQRLEELATWLGALDSRPKGKFPIVDGSIPPNLMYLDDGSLVYEETY